jgi:hypothetical protein
MKKKRNRPLKAKKGITYMVPFSNRKLINKNIEKEAGRDDKEYEESPFVYILLFE